ncbi:MAG: RHS repeat protein, partial [Chloroflexi bacterium]|nr:RHS repeat protein [Chloroflexota bacterium]
MTDHTDRDVEFGYDSDNNLSVVTDTRELQWTYVYTSPPPHTEDPHLLYKIINPEDEIVEKTYFDSEGRAIGQEDGLGRTVVDIDYNDDYRYITESGREYTDLYDATGFLISQEDDAGTQTYDFDASFNRSYDEDGNGNPTQYLRDSLGRTLVITAANNKTTTFDYYGKTTNLKSSTDARNRTTHYLYNGQNNLISTTNSLGHSTLYTYNARGQTLAVTDENGNITRYGYDSWGNRTVITDALDHVTRYEYDDLGRVVTTTDALNKVTVNEYDNADNLVKVTENYLASQPKNHYITPSPGVPGGHYNLITQYVYDGANRRTIVTDTLGRVTVNLYDDAGRLSQTIENQHPTQSGRNYQKEYNLTTSYGYDEFGRQVAITDTLDHVTRTKYDEDTGRVERTIVNYKNGAYNGNSPDEDIITEYVYDAAGNVVQTIELPGAGEERTTCTVYDNLNRVERTLTNCVTATPAISTSYSIESDEDLATVYVYDDVGNQTEVIDPLGRKTRYEYDALNRVVTMTNPLNGQTIYDYGPAGNRLTTTDAEGRTTSFAYDALNRAVTTTNHLLGQSRVQYDAVGNRTHTIDAENRTTTYTHDSLYRLTQTENAESEIQNQTYDALGNRLTTTDAENTVTHYEYDNLNRLIVTTLNYVSGGPSNNETNVETSVSYDALGRRTQVTDGRGKSITYGYDGLGRTIAITNALTHVSHFTYNGHGNRRFVTNAASESTEFQYDGLDRLVKTIDPLLNTTVYTYTKGGERVMMADAETVKTRYQYDDLSRLTLVTENYVQAGPVDEQTNVKTQYGYDRVGNRTVITDARNFTTTYRYDGLNRRTQVTDAEGNTTQYGYDRVGNRTVMTDANRVAGQGGAVTTFIYDQVNRLTNIDYSDSTPDVN